MWKSKGIFLLFWTCHHARCTDTRAFLLSVRRGRRSHIFLPSPKKRTVNHENSWHFHYLSQAQCRSFFYKLCHGASSLSPARSILVLRQKGWFSLWWSFTFHGLFLIPHPQKWQQASTSQVMGQKMMNVKGICWNYFALRSKRGTLPVSLNFSFVQRVCPDHKNHSTENNNKNQDKIK